MKYKSSTQKSIQVKVN